MAKSTATLEWCVIRLGEDLNWWVEEVSDTIHWDTDGLSIIDPRQIAHIVELIEPLRDYGFDPDIFERAFLPFRIEKNLKKNQVRVARVKESLLESEEKLFALPDTLNDENSAYADLLDHLTRMRVKLLNDIIDFDQKLTVDELEEEIREESNASFMEGKAVHLYTEIVSVLDYVPAGWEIDGDEEEAPAKKEAADAEDFPDVEEDEEALKGDDSLRWDDEEEEKEEKEEKEDDGDEDDEEEDEDAAPKKKRSRR